jgi:hypothetical protein
LGREMLVDLIYYLTSNYGTDQTVTWLVDNTYISILPSMNPDGFELRRRSNSKGYDLNRNFPDQFVPNYNEQTKQAETDGVMKWSLSKPYVLSANFHGGSVVANYPYDGNEERMSGRYSASPDDAAFIRLAKAYSQAHSFMHKSLDFKGGITNGADWYVLYGGMQDWNYLYANTMEITVELSYVKFVSESTLATEWDNNKDALIQYMRWVHRGVKGLVTDERGNAITNAIINVYDEIAKKDLRSMKVASSFGDYYKVLAPGTYSLIASANGYRSLNYTVQVSDGLATTRNFVLLH